MNSAVKLIELANVANNTVSAHDGREWLCSGMGARENRRRRSIVRVIFQTAPENPEIEYAPFDRKGLRPTSGGESPKITIFKKHFDGPSIGDFLGAGRKIAKRHSGNQFVVLCATASCN